jgi:hypothetical protein
MSKAEEWLERIDHPETEGDIDRRAVRRMQDGAVDVLQEASRMSTDIFVFADGSGLYEKRKDDWFPMNAEEVRHAQGEDDEEDESEGAEA